MQTIARIGQTPEIRLTKRERKTVQDAAEIMRFIARNLLSESADAAANGIESTLDLLDGKTKEPTF